MNNATHGHRSNGACSITYNSYRNAKQRCTNPRAHNYRYYGAKGVEFLFGSFQHLLDTIGERPDAEHQLDRIDPTGNYEPGNVQWSKRGEGLQRKDMPCGERAEL